MRVAHVTLYPPKGEKHVKVSGVASYSKNLVTHIPDQADNIVVCNAAGETMSQYKEGCVRIRRAFKRRPDFIFNVHSELKKVGADVVHIQQELALFGNIITAYLLQWLVFFWRKKTVITLHGVVDPTKIDKQFVAENNSKLPVWAVKLAFRIIYTPLMKWSQKIIVHEQFFKDIIVDKYHIDHKKVVVIPHGVEALQAEDKRTARRRLELPQAADLSLFMGYATGYKGLDTLIEGFGEHAKRNPKAFLVIGAGKHPKLQSDETYQCEYERLQKKAASLIPATQYKWVGFIDGDKIGSYYSASDVSLYPYTTALASSGPMSFAIGFEKPFLVSTAFADIFSEYPQLLFERRGSNLAEKLDYFFDHQDEFLATSTDLKEKRNWKRVGERTLRVYKNIMRRGLKA